MLTFYGPGVGAGRRSETNSRVDVHERHTLAALPHVGISGSLHAPVVLRVALLRVAVAANLLLMSERRAVVVRVQPAACGQVLEADALAALHNRPLRAHVAGERAHGPQAVGVVALRVCSVVGGRASEDTNGTAQEHSQAVTDCWPEPEPYAISWECRRYLVSTCTSLMEEPAQKVGAPSVRRAEIPSASCGGRRATHHT